MLKDGYLADSYRHSLVCKLADKSLAALTDAQIIKLCPDDYGPTITDDHRCAVWDQAYEEFDALDDYVLSRKAEALLAPDGRVQEILAQFNNIAQLFGKNTDKPNGGNDA